jgi:hypothetical protein
LRHLHAKGVPTVVSTIYWAWEPDEQRAESIFRLPGPATYASLAVDAVRRRLPDPLRYRLERPPHPASRRRASMRWSADRAGCHAPLHLRARLRLPPNSHVEYDHLAKRFDFERLCRRRTPSTPAFAEATRGLPAQIRPVGFRPVLCRRQGRKNQRRLIEAANALALPLVLVGSEEARYGRRRRLPALTVHFLGELRGDDLRTPMRGARTHALVSFARRPACQSRSRARRRHDRARPRLAPRVFRRQRFHCQPTDLGSTGAALSAAYAAKPDPALKQRVLRDYSWARTAAHHRRIPARHREAAAPRHAFRGRRRICLERHS